MKWLFTFAVVAGDLRQRFEQDCQAVIEGSRKVVDMENDLQQAVAQRLGDVVFYRAIMDDDGEAHRELAFWIVSKNAGLFTAWRFFVTYGVLAVTTAAAPALGGKSPTHREIVAAAAGATGRSAVAFLDSFFQAARFARQGKGLLVMTARMLGASKAPRDHGSP